MHPGLMMSPSMMGLLAIGMMNHEVRRQPRERVEGTPHKWGVSTFGDERQTQRRQNRRKARNVARSIKAKRKAGRH